MVARQVEVAAVVEHSSRSIDIRQPLEYTYGVCYIYIQEQAHMHPAGFQYSNGMIKGSDFAVRPCRTAPICSLLTTLPPR